MPNSCGHTRIAVVCEAAADFRTASALIDRVLCDAATWIEDLSLFREYVGSSGQFIAWKHVPRLYEAKKLPARHGHFGEQPAEPDAKAARKAIVLCKYLHEPLHAVVLVRDQDDQPSRLKGLEQARTEASQSTLIVIGFAVIMRESWELCGFDAKGDGETQRLLHVEKASGRKVQTESHRFEHRDESEPRSPKYAIATLTSGDSNRAHDCIQSTPLETLRSRGADNGLAAFLDEITQRIVPLFTSRNA